MSWVRFTVVYSFIKLCGTIGFNLFINDGYKYCANPGQYHYGVTCVVVYSGTLSNYGEYYMDYTKSQSGCIGETYKPDLNYPMEGATFLLCHRYRGIVLYLSRFLLLQQLDDFPVCCHCTTRCPLCCAVLFLYSLQWFRSTADPNQLRGDVHLCRRELDTVLDTPIHVLSVRAGSSCHCDCVD
jgi:hypothetical protein